MNIIEWKKKNQYRRNYAHFDKKVSLYSVWNYITDPNKVSSHGFYPFIHYTKNFYKYSKKNGIKPKEREICYSSHVDRYIYQYYSYLLNQKYNVRLKKDGIEHTAIAYRDDIGKNNIHFAKTAFDYIKGLDNCFIIVGDFTKFFDNLDHKYLKKRVCDLMEVQELPGDYYAVFKNITKYSLWNMKDLLDLYGLPYNENGIEELNQKEQVLTNKQYKQLKKQFIKPNKNNYGIPQGSAISAVFSNIYMLDADKKIYDFVNDRNGLYMRYSDDFIVILPDAEGDNFKSELDYIRKTISDVPNLILQPDKTQVYSFHSGIVMNLNDDFLEGVNKGQNVLSYLGFTFDGKSVTIRDKTITKYYYRMYRKVKTIVKAEGVTSKGNKISCKNLYIKYSLKGAHVGKGNFISYVERAQKIFGDKEDINRGTKKHLQKIRKRLGNI